MKKAATTYQIQYLDWDTKFFGAKMGEVMLDLENPGFRFSENIWKRTIDFARDESYQFLFCQLNAVYQDISAVLLKQGAALGDVLITLALNLTGNIENMRSKFKPAASSQQFCEASTDDLPAIIDIAVNSFIHSRFFQDPRFDITKARQF